MTELDAILSKYGLPTAMLVAVVYGVVKVAKVLYPLVVRIADAIESLIGALQTSDKEKTKILGELAHSVATGDQRLATMDAKLDDIGEQVVIIARNTSTQIVAPVAEKKQ